MHFASCIFITIIAVNQTVINITNSFKCQRVREIAACRRDISFDCMGQSIHTCMSSQSFRHAQRDIGIQNSNVRRDFKICQRIFYISRVISNDRERSYFCCRTACRRNCYENSLIPEFGYIERFLDFFKGCFGVLVKDPHGFRRIYR